MKKCLLSVFCLLASVSLWADDQLTTLMVTDSGEKVAVGRVDFLLAADDDETFSVVLKEEGVILNVTRVTFEEGVDGLDTAVATVQNGPVLVGEVVSTLTLSGCTEGDEIRIYSNSGALVKTAVAEATTVIAVDDLASGYYILSVGKSAVKFIKK